VSARVLVVDDEPAVLDLVARVLGREGYEVLTAPDGDAALAVVSQGPVDCLLVDKFLPGRHGFEVMALARALQPQLKVVLMTATPEPFSFADARPDAVLPKPFKSLDAIVAVIAQVLDAPATGTTLEGLTQRLTQVVADIAPRRKKP
jgi:CheY-like chemotaxis protein